MTDDAIAKAHDRLAVIRKEIAMLQVEAREIEGALTVMRRFGAVLSNEAPAPRQTPSEVARIIEEGARNSAAQGFQMSQAEFEVLAAKAMNEIGRPMTRTQILDWLERNGTPLQGTDASKNAGTKLWRAKEKFINLRGSGYWFRDRPCEAVGYDPNSTFAILDGLLGPEP